jgi:hypothetical protein
MASLDDPVIGMTKPTISVSDAWRIPRTHGLVEHACVCVKRQQVATVVRPSPRNKKATLLVWPLEGPLAHQVAHSHEIVHNEGADDVYIHSVEYLEIFEGWAVFQVPAVCHLFAGFDLHPLCTVPIVMHNREIVCTQMCTSRNEVVLGGYDSRVIILSLFKEMVEKKADASALTTHLVMQCNMKKRLSWSVGSSSVWPHAFCLDEGFHLQGYRLFVAVVSDLVAYDYETGSQLFRTHCHSKILSMDMRRDTPCLCVGNQANEVVVYSARPGSLGKVLDTFHGHQSAVSAIRIEHASKVCYTMDTNSELCCWNVDQHILLFRQKLVDGRENSEKQKNNPWRKVELHPSFCRLQLATVQGNDMMLAHTPDHQESIMVIKSHLRYVGRFQSNSPVIWMRCIRSRALLEALGRELREVTVPGLDDNVLLVVSQDGTIQVMHTFSGDIISIIKAPHCHEMFLRNKDEALEAAQPIAEPSKQITQHGDDGRGSNEGQTSKAQVGGKQKDATAAATGESDAAATMNGAGQVNLNACRPRRVSLYLPVPPSVHYTFANLTRACPYPQAISDRNHVRGGAKQGLGNDARKLSKLIETFKKKNGYGQTSEEIRKKLEAQDAQVCRRLPFCHLAFHYRQTVNTVDNIVQRPPDSLSHCFF